MSVKKYVAATSRQALAQVRAELGPDAVILANRRTALGIEVTALAGNDLDRMIDAPPPAATAAKKLPAIDGNASFKEFVAQAYADTAPSMPAPAKNRPPQARRANARAALPEPRVAAPAPKVEAQPPVAPQAPAAPREEQRLREEIAALKRTMEKRLSEIAWNGAGTLDPVRAEVTAELSERGFSKELIGHALAKVATTRADAATASQAIENLLVNNLGCTQHDLIETGGVFAFVGPTGVGKTTTVAKVAARAVVRFGAAKVALISADGFRIGAQDQLRTYARILGVPLLVAHDKEQLAQVLDTLKDKHLVLVDTAGLGPRDPRLADLASLLDQPRLRKVVLLSATAQPEALDHSVRAYATGATAAILTKLDEAVKLAGAIEALLRHRLTLHYVTNGQRVPEDLHAAHARMLVHRAMRHDDSQPPADMDLAWKRAA